MDIPSVTWLVVFSQSALCLSVIALIVLTIFVIRQKQSSQFITAVIGILTAWTTIYIWVIVIVSAINYDFSQFVQNKTTSDSALLFFYWLSFLSKFTSALTYSLMAYYLFHAKQTASLSKKVRMYYQIGFVLLPFVAMPLYYLKIIKGATMRFSKIE